MSRVESSRVESSRVESSLIDYFSTLLQASVDAEFIELITPVLAKIGNYSSGPPKIGSMWITQMTIFQQRDNETQATFLQRIARHSLDRQSKILRGLEFSASRSTDNLVKMSAAELAKLPWREKLFGDIVYQFRQGPVSLDLATHAMPRLMLMSQLVCIVFLSKQWLSTSASTSWPCSDCCICRSLSSGTDFRFCSNWFSSILPQCCHS